VQRHLPSFLLLSASASAHCHNISEDGVAAARTKHLSSLSQRYHCSDRPAPTLLRVSLKGARHRRAGALPGLPVLQRHSPCPSPAASRLHLRSFPRCQWRGEAGVWGGCYGGGGRRSDAHHHTEWSITDRARFSLCCPPTDPRRLSSAPLNQAAIPCPHRWPRSQWAISAKCSSPLRLLTSGNVSRRHGRSHVRPRRQSWACFLRVQGETETVFPRVPPLEEALAALIISHSAGWSGNRKPLPPLPQNKDTLEYFNKIWAHSWLQQTI